MLFLAFLTLKYFSRASLASKKVIVPSHFTPGITGCFPKVEITIQSTSSNMNGACFLQVFVNPLIIVVVVGCINILWIVLIYIPHVVNVMCEYHLVVASQYVFIFFDYRQIFKPILLCMFLTCRCEC